MRELAVLGRIPWAADRDADSNAFDAMKVEIRMEVRNEVFISVDVETSGPIPGEYSMLSIGACLVDAPETSFERTLKPLNRNADPEALAVTGFSLEELERNGVEPRQAMTEFDAWIKAACSKADVPVFVGLNAPSTGPSSTTTSTVFTVKTPSVSRRSTSRPTIWG